MDLALASSSHQGFAHLALTLEASSICTSGRRNPCEPFIPTLSIGFQKGTPVKHVLLVPIIALALAGSSLAQSFSSEPTPYFGVSTSFTTSTLQPWQLAVQGGTNNLIGPFGARASAGITLGTDGLSYALQGNLIASGGRRGPLGFYTGLGYGVKLEKSATDSRWTHGPNAIVGIEYALVSNLALTVEGQVDYLFNILPSAIPWRFGVSVGARIYLR
jgi:hypothetical protein